MDATRLKHYAHLMRLDKPVGVFLLLWPVLWSLWIAAEGPPRLDVLVVFTLGVFLMRSAGCVINDYADRDIDPQVTRTQSRPLAVRAVAPREALALFAALSLAAFALVLLMPPVVILMSVPALALAVSYPWIKRLHYMPQAHLGLAFSWGVLMAWVAQTGDWPTATPWLLFGAGVSLVLAYDTIYALADYDSDVRAGVKSSAILFGRHCEKWIAAFQLATLAQLAVVGRLESLGVWYGGALVAAFALFVRQLRLIRRREPAACLQAFRNNATVGGLVFTALLIEYF